MAISRASVPEPYVARLASVRDTLTRRKLDAYFVHDRMDQYWLTGFSGEDGSVVLTADHVVLLTDGRFDEAATREAPYARKVLRKVRGPEANAKEIKRLRVRRIGFNPDQVSVREFNELGKLIRPARLLATDDPIRPLRMQKTPGEIDRIRRAIHVAEEAFKAVRKWIRPGVTEREVAAQIEFEMRRRGAQGPSFPTIVAFGPNSSLPHYDSGDRRWMDSEPVLIDWGAQVDWYCSDLTRVFWTGAVLPEYRTITDVVRQAHDAAIEAVRPGAKAASVDAVARRLITKAGYGKEFNHALGHGFGLRVHEGPRVGRKSKDVLRPGMVVTIEPGIYIPGVGGARIEDDVLVTETGHEVLSSLPTTV